MALRKPTTTNTAAAFEQEPGAAATASAVAEREPTATAVAEREPAPAAQTPAPRPAPVQTPEPTAAAKVEATTAIAAAATSSVATLNDAANVAKKFKAEVAAMKGGADFSYGSHRVFKGDNGAITEMSGEKLNLGRWVQVRLLAWDTSFVVSPGEQGKDSGGFVAYSKDGVTIDSVGSEELKSWVGKSVDDYITYLRDEEEFASASRRDFIDCECAVLNCEDEPEFKEAVQITLSSSSMPAFRKYQSDLESTAKCVQMGLPGYKLPEDPFTFYFLREVASKKNNTWTKLRICSTLPAKI